VRTLDVLMNNPATTYAELNRPAPGMHAAMPEGYGYGHKVQGLNVRATPGKTSPIIGELPNKSEAIRVHSQAQRRMGFARPCSETGGEVDRPLFNGVGWVMVRGSASVDGNYKGRHKPLPGSFD